MLALALLPSARALALEADALVPGGSAVGIDLETRGVVIVGFSDVDTAQGCVRPAEAAGMQVGDVILRVGERETDSAAAFLTAMREKRKVRIRFASARGRRNTWVCIPYKLEYSAKDDKFRVITFGRNGGRLMSVNLGRIRDCRPDEPWKPEEYCPRPFPEETLVLRLTDERNALERAMLHFSHLEKETERLDNDHYRITLRYHREDETELLIRVLSFGPVLEVQAPERFRELIRERLKKQKACGL